MLSVAWRPLCNIAMPDSAMRNDGGTPGEEFYAPLMQRVATGAHGYEIQIKRLPNKTRICCGLSQDVYDVVLPIRRYQGKRYLNQQQTTPTHVERTRLMKACR
ncbi:unnamed protein product [Ectocarpus sp. 8 AP-2014]